MANIWRHALEAMTVLGFAISVWAVPLTEVKWFLGGATSATLTCVLLYEILLTRKDREIFDLYKQAGNALGQRDQEIERLKKEIDKLADPELMSIYKENERERLRIERDQIERDYKAKQEADDAARRSIQRSDELLDDWARQYFRLNG